MHKLKQKPTDQIRPNDSLKVNKMKRESRISVVKVHPRSKSQLQINPQSISSINKSGNHSIDTLKNKRYAPTQNSIRVTLPQLQFYKLSQSNCQEQERQNHGENENQQVLAERAKNFISRLRNQKRHIKGLFMLRKKEEEQRKKQQQLRKRQQNMHLQAINQQSKIAKMMSRILQHEQRINCRLNSNLERFRNITQRAQTLKVQAAGQQLSPEKDENFLNPSYSKVLSLKQKIKNLQLWIQSLSSV